MTEWRSIPGFEGFYEASTDGQVRSVDRTVTHVQRGGSVGERRLRGRILRPSTKNGYLWVSLYTCLPGQQRTMLYVHRAVLLTFVGEPFEGADACHRDGIRTNNTVENLYWGTRAENIADAVRHGTAHWVGRTRCVNGHEYAVHGGRRRVNPKTGNAVRSCRACASEPSRDTANARGSL